MKKGQKRGQNIETSPFKNVVTEEDFIIPFNLSCLRGQDAVRAALQETNTTQAALSQKLGYEGQSTISFAINSKRMSLDKLLEMLNGLGYTVLVAKKLENGYDLKCELERG